MENDLIKKIETAATAQGLSASTLCLRAVNDGKLIQRLKDGGSVTLATFVKVEAYLAKFSQKETA